MRSGHTDAGTPNRKFVPMEYEERRSAKRYRIKSPLRVNWSGMQETLTQTVEISTRGVYFFLSEPLALGTPIEFVLTLLPEQDESKPIRLKCRGNVLRTEEIAEGRTGIAASIESYDFARP